MTTGQLSLADAITIDRLGAESPDVLLRARPLVSTPVADCARFAEGLRLLAKLRYGHRLPERR